MDETGLSHYPPPMTPTTPTTPTTPATPRPESAFVAHIALHVVDLEAARAFYGGVLGCRETRAAGSWVDFDFFGQQLSLHRGELARTRLTGRVAGVDVPMPHCGVALSLAGFAALVERLKAAGNVDVVVPPTVRFAGEPGEQRTVFIRDPSGNALEFKGFASRHAVFAS